MGGGSYNHTAPLRARLSRHGRTLRASRARATRSARATCACAQRPSVLPATTPTTHDCVTYTCSSCHPHRPHQPEPPSCSLDATRPRPWRAPSSTHAYTTHTLRSSSSLVLTITPLSLTWRHLRLHGFTGSSPTSACSVVSCTACTTIAAAFRITAVRHDPHSAATTSTRRPRVPGPAPYAL